MRALWADPGARARLTPEAAAAQCLVAPQQVVRQPTRAGASLAGELGDGTLVLLQLNAANARAPSPEMAFMTGTGRAAGARVGSSVAGGGVARGAGVSAWITIRSSPRSISAT